MSKLDWEKANRKEAVWNGNKISIVEIRPLKKHDQNVATTERLPKRKSNSQTPDPEHLAQIAKHAKRRQYQKTYYGRLRARVNKIESSTPYKSGVESGKTQERERIIKLLEEHYAESTLLPTSILMTGYLNAIKASIALIKGEQK